MGLMEDIWDIDRQRKRIIENQKYVDAWSKQLDQQIRQNAYNSYEMPQDELQRATSLSDEGRANLMRRLAMMPTAPQEEPSTYDVLAGTAKSFVGNWNLDSTANEIGTDINAIHRGKENYVQQEVNDARRATAMYGLSDIIEPEIKENAETHFEEIKENVPKLQAQYREQQKYLEDVNQQHHLDNAGFIGKQAVGIASSLPNMMERMGRTYLTSAVGGLLAPVTGGTSAVAGSVAGQVLGAKYAFDTQYAQAYMDAIDKKASPEIADFFATTSGSIEAGLGQLPFLKFGKGSALGSILAEGGEEAFTEFLHISNELYHNVGDPTFKKAIDSGDYLTAAKMAGERMLQAGTTGAVMGAGMHGLGKLGNAVQNKFTGKNAEQEVQPEQPNTDNQPSEEPVSEPQPKRDTTSPFGINNPEQSEFVDEDGNVTKTQPQQTTNPINSATDEQIANIENHDTGLAEKIRNSQELLAGEDLTDDERQGIQQQLNSHLTYAQKQGWIESQAVKSEQKIANNSLFSKAKSKIVDLFNFATQSNEYDWEDIADVSQVEVERIKQATGLEIDTSYKHVMETNAIKHALNRHGDEKAETNYGQVAITKDDFELIPEIIYSPDEVVAGGKAKQTNLDTIKYKKTFDDGTTYVVEEVRKRRNKLAFKTMYKVKPATTGAPMQKAPSIRSKPFPAPKQVSDGSITNVQNDLQAGQQGEVASEDQDTRYSFAGVNAKKADLDSLEMAKEAEDIPALEGGVYDWQRGTDGKWRFEIDDSKSKLKEISRLKNFLKGGRTNLGDIFEHKELFDNYPELKKVDVVDRNLGEKVRGQVAQGVNSAGKRVVRIELNENLSPEEKRSVLLHEIQHLIQEREGFATGSNDEVSGFDAYYRSAGEVEARNVQKRADFTDIERAEIPHWETEDVARSDQIVHFEHPASQHSQSPIKSVEANIKRGKERMTQAILNKADVKRGMYNNEFGWVDFVWGDDGLTKPLNRKGEPKGKGISHIFEARARKNGMTTDEVSQMLVNDIVETIAKGTVLNPNPKNIAKVKLYGII